MYGHEFEALIKSQCAKARDHLIKVYVKNFIHFVLSLIKDSKYFTSLTIAFSSLFALSCHLKKNFYKVCPVTTTRSNR